jgi:CTP-dependent riboflavin kinase
MKCEHTFTGRIVTGTGKAAFFTQLDWVMEQCSQKLGFTPFPGTLNIEILGDYIINLDGFLTSEVIELLPPDPKNCSAHVVTVHLEGIPAAIIVPEDKVRVHGKNIIEIIAPVNIRKALRKNDGDLVSGTIGDEFDNSKDNYGKNLRNDRS